MEKRLEHIKAFADLADEDLEVLKQAGALGIDRASNMIENVIGTFELPMGIAVNFLINGRDYMIPMAIEEPSVVAASSKIAKVARQKGGIEASTTEPIMIAQIQLTDIDEPEKAKDLILAKKDELLAYANEQDPMLVKFGGGAKDMEVRLVETRRGVNVITHLLVDCRDAMGANAVNSMAEALAPKIEELTAGRVYLRILSNLADKRLARAKCVFDSEALGGEGVVDGILEAYEFAEADPYRAATHNKGIMNGIVAVVRATGNDTRAVEAGAHSYAARSGQYRSLTQYEKTDEGDLLGTIELPMAVGLIGGATAVHPTAKLAVKILGVETASELGQIIASVGLVQNVAALRALAAEGIQRGHMALHARNVAVSAGAPPELVDEIVKRMVEEGKVRMDRAKELIEELKK
ncbi:MAG: hydroxymethylglutaryl-CoA reductase, degradative [Thermoplasmata archaeon]|nr:MAG: hydroxymethylglutaryl-CoA reductase, degradative [Thermoplasmata archaeon]